MTIVLIVIFALLAVFILRQIDHKRDRDEMSRLADTQPAHPKIFSSTMVLDLPEPAQRYFNFSILEGTPLYTVADITKQGKFSLGTKVKPNYLDMSARQVLAAPEGFMWKTKAGKGLMQLTGSDGTRWTRFWMAGLIPVARFGGNADHTRSAFGRFIAESVFWTTAALLPQPGVTWEAVDKDTARVTINHQGLEQSVTIRVSQVGEPTDVNFARWSNANPEKVFRLQPFGGFLSKYQEFQGFRVPTHVEAGNLFGTEDYFPFFIVDVTSIRFPKNGL